MKKSLKKLCVSLLCLLMVGGAVLNTSALTDNTSSSTKITSLADTDVTAIKQMDMLNLNINTIDPNSLTYDSSQATVTFEKENAYTGYMIMTTPDNTATNAAFSYRNLCSFKYANCGSIAGRSVDCKVSILNVKKGQGQAQAVSDKFIFYWFNQNGSGVSGQSLNGVTTQYHYSCYSSLEVETKFDIVWSGTDDIVDLPFVHAALDLDTYDTSCSVDEGYETIDGYENDYVVFKSCELICDKGPKGIYWHIGKHVTGGFTGDESYTKGGVFAKTQSGSFSGRFNSGTCASYVNIIPPAFSQPQKDLVGQQSNFQVGDTVNYTVTLKMPEWKVDTIVRNESLVFEDVIPDILNYNSATVTFGGTDVTSTAGTLTYDSGSHTVRYTMNPNWMANVSNYNGQDLVLNLVTELTSSDYYYIENVATVYIDGIEFSSTAEFTMLKDISDGTINYFSKGQLLQTEPIGGVTTYYINQNPITNPLTGVTVSDEKLPINPGYIFAGWYTSRECTVKYPKIFSVADYKDSEDNVNLYAGWVKIENFDSNDSGDSNIYAGALNGFDLQGVQLRKQNMIDQNSGSSNAGSTAIRFITTYGNKMLSELKALNNICLYGYVASKSESITSLTVGDANTTDIDCTSGPSRIDHFSGSRYRLSSLVIDYEATSPTVNVSARPYIKYVDANGYDRIVYNTYTGASLFCGGCKTSLDAVSALVDQYTSIER